MKQEPFSATDLEYSSIFNRMWMCGFIHTCYVCMLLNFFFLKKNPNKTPLLLLNCWCMPFKGKEEDGE